jgi:non-ribosomal peptide synthetase component F
VHQDLPFDKVVEALRLQRDPSYNPVFQVNFRAHAGDRLGPEFPGVEASPMSVDIGFSRFDLSLELQVQDDAITGYFEYDRDLFEPTTIDALVGDLETLLVSVLADPDLPILALPPPSAANPTRLGRAPSGPRRSR